MCLHLANSVDKKAVVLIFADYFAPKNNWSVGFGSSKKALADIVFGVRRGSLPLRAHPPLLAETVVLAGIDFGFAPLLYNCAARDFLTHRIFAGRVPELSRNFEPP